MAATSGVQENLPSNTHLDGETTQIPLNSRLQQTSLAAALPVETLTRIFDLAMMVTPVAYSDLNDEYEMLPITSPSNLTEVCKSWVQPARRAFYRDLSGTTLFLSTWPILLYDTLHRFNGSVGSLVRKFDPGKTFRAGGTIVFSRMLEAMPNLEDLSIYTHHIPKLCKGHHWDRLQSLFVQSNGRIEDSSRIAANQLPASLANLAISGRVLIFWSSPEDMSSRLQLPRIQSFKLVNVHVSDPPHSLFLPSLPNLETLEIAGYLDSESFREIVQEFASSLKALRIHQQAGDTFTLDPSLASKLKKLEKLEYIGVSRTQTQRISADCFPVNLRRLDVTSNGTSHYSMDILSLLNESNFLPNLEECPRIVYAFSYQEEEEDDDHDDDEDDYLEKRRKESIAHYTEASKAYNQIMSRPKIAQCQTFHRECGDIDSAEDQVYCLPTPLPYLQSLPSGTRELLEELTASGQISGYSVRYKQEST